MTHSIVPVVSAALAAEMDQWAALLRESVALSFAVAQSNAAGPRQGSPYALEVEELSADTRFPDGPLELVTLDTLRYLGGASRHCLAIADLLTTREAVISLMPLLRAQLETYGRIAWFLAPDMEDKVEDREEKRYTRVTPQMRVARHHMEYLATICHRRYSASRRGDSRSRQNEIKLDRENVRRKLLALFPDAQVEWRCPGDEFEWKCCGHAYCGLGEATTLFSRLVRTGDRGNYDSLSDLAHPSLITIQQLTGSTDVGNHLRYEWHIDRGSIARQVWSSGALHCTATKLVAAWLGQPIDAVDEFLDRFEAACPHDAE
jgi:hypothetical protein